MSGTWVGDAPRAVTIINTLRWHGCFGFWPGKGRGVWGLCSDMCPEGVQMHRTGKKKVKSEKKKKKKKK